MSGVVLLPDWSYHWATNVSSRSYDVNHPTNAGHARRTATRPDPARRRQSRHCMPRRPIPPDLRPARGRGSRYCLTAAFGGRWSRRPGRRRPAKWAGDRRAPARARRSRGDHGTAQPRVHRARVPLLPGGPCAAALGGRRQARRPPHALRQTGCRSSNWYPALRASAPRLELDGRSLSPATFEDGRADDIGAAPAHERDDIPAEAGAAPAPQPDRTGPLDRAPLPAWPGRRLVLRDAAVPRTRPRRLDARPAGGRRHGRRAAPVRARAASGSQPASTASPGIRRADAPPDDARRARDAAARRHALRFVRSCSSALPPQLMREAEARYGVPMIEAYGMTEASHQMASNPLPPGGARAGLGRRPGGRRDPHRRRGRARRPGGSPARS